MNFETLGAGLQMVFSFQSLLWILIGTVLGMVAGTLPGINDTTMVAILLPLVFKTPPQVMVCAMIGIYAANTYYCGTAGILYNIPGGGHGIPTTIEGYRLTLQGKTSEALTTACGASLFGNTIGSICMVVMLPLFIYIIKFFGSAEKALLGVFALVLICSGVLTREDPIKGLGSIGIGLFFSIVGTQENTGVIRYAGTQVFLWEGFNIMWIVLGMFAMPQLMGLTSFKDTFQNLRDQKKIKVESPWEYYSLAVRQIKKYFGMMVRGSAIGTIIGIIPGIGSFTAGWMAYSMADRYAKEPELIGQGSAEAIACIESSNNAALPGALIPMFSLGIPGSGTAAIIMSVFMVAGLSPGPMMMERSGDIIWCIIFGCLICGVAFFLESYPFRVMCGAMLSLPMHWLLIILGPLILLGAFVSSFNIFSVNVMMAVTVLSLILTYLRVPSIGVLLGVVLGGMIESEALRAYQVGGIARFLRPFPVVLILIILSIFGVGIYNTYFKKANDKNKKVKALRMVGQGDDEEYEDEDGEELVKKRDPELVKNAEVYRKLVFSIILVGVGIWGFTRALKFSEMAGLWPRLMFCLFFFLPAAIMLLQALSGLKRIPAYFKNRPPMKKDVKWNKVEQIVVFVVMLVCGNLIPLIGFVWSCALFAFIITWFLNPPKPHVALIAGVVIGAFIWGVNAFCQFNLPTGLFGL